MNELELTKKLDRIREMVRHKMYQECVGCEEGWDHKRDVFSDDYIYANSSGRWRTCPASWYRELLEWINK